MCNWSLKWQTGKFQIFPSWHCMDDQNLTVPVCVYNYINFHNAGWNSAQKHVSASIVFYRWLQTHCSTFLLNTSVLNNKLNFWTKDWEVFLRCICLFVYFALYLCWYMWINNNSTILKNLCPVWPIQQKSWLWYGMIQLSNRK